MEVTFAGAPHNWVKIATACDVDLNAKMLRFPGKLCLCKQSQLIQEPLFDSGETLTDGPSQALGPRIVRHTRIDWR